MRGSQWEGAGRGPGIRLEWVLVVVAVLVSASVLAVYYFGGESKPPSLGQALSVTTVSTTGVACGGGSMPAAARAAVQDSRFQVLSGGLCYNYMGEAPSAGGDLLTFYHYNGTIAYPCGTAAQALVGGVIQVLVSNGTVSSVSAAVPQSEAAPCPAAPPVAVVSVVDVGSLIPAVPQLNVTLQASPGSPTITSLKASLVYQDGSQYYDFLAHPATLSGGAEVSKTEIISTNFAIVAGLVYPMTVWGTFADGQTFAYVAYVQVAGVP